MREVKAALSGHQKFSPQSHIFFVNEHLKLFSVQFRSQKQRGGAAADDIDAFFQMC